MKEMSAPVELSQPNNFGGTTQSTSATAIEVSRFYRESNDNGRVENISPREVNLTASVTNEPSPPRNRRHSPGTDFEVHVAITEESGDGGK
jgi:hypothetical protein